MRFLISCPKPPFLSPERLSKNDYSHQKGSPFFGPKNPNILSFSNVKWKSRKKRIRRYSRTKHEVLSVRNTKIFPTGLSTDKFGRENEGGPGPPSIKPELIVVFLDSPLDVHSEKLAYSFTSLTFL